MIWVLDLPMTDNFLRSELSMLVIMRSVSLPLCFAEPAGLSPSSKCCLVNTLQGWGVEQSPSMFQVDPGGQLTPCYHR